MYWWATARKMSREPTTGHLVLEGINNILVKYCIIWSLFSLVANCKVMVRILRI